MIRNCKSSMYLGAQVMVSERPTAEITGVVIYAFVPHFCRHGRVKKCYQTCLDPLRNLENPPEHSLESRNGKVGCVSCSCYKRHFPSGSHHLRDDDLWVTNNLPSLQALTFHFVQTARSESVQGSLTGGSTGARTSSSPADIARLQGLAPDKRIWDDGRHQGGKLYVEDCSCHIGPLLSEGCYINIPSTRKGTIGALHLPISRSALGTILCRAARAPQQCIRMGESHGQIDTAERAFREQKMMGMTRFCMAAGDVIIPNNDSPNATWEKIGEPLRLSSLGAH